MRNGFFKNSNRKQAGTQNSQGHRAWGIGKKRFCRLPSAVCCLTPMPDALKFQHVFRTHNQFVYTLSLQYPKVILVLAMIFTLPRLQESFRRRALC